MINNVDKDLIKELRKRTGIGLLKCKRALIESDGNIELAVDNIRKLGLQIDLNRSTRCTLFGLVAAKILPNYQTGVIIEINCETDFVAKNDIFCKFSETVINIALEESINNIDVLRSRIKQQSVVLMNTVGENIKLNNFSVIKGNFLVDYVHGSKIGVIVSVSRKINNSIVKNIAMHIAARNPRYIYVDDIPEEIIIRERQIQTDIAAQLGKSQKVVKNIIEGRMDNFINELVLTKQEFVMDTNKKVEDILNEHSIKIDSFVRFEIGSSY